MIDISDGLSTDLEHICEESHVGAEIDAKAIPLAPAGRGRRDFVALKYALHGGDEYELLFTSSRPVPSKIEGIHITRIGRVTKNGGMCLIDADRKKHRLKAQGWEHF